MNFADFHSYWTILVLVAFVAIVVWAFSGKRKQDFDEASRIPLEEDDAPDADAQSRGDSRNG